MNVNKKIIISDYDQTFYINDEDIERNKVAVSKFEEKGNLFIIATGRSYLDFKNKVEAYNINSYYVTGDSIEIISSKTNKSNAIRLLTQKFKIDDKNIYTIGDGFSDIEMVKDFNGYCMEESVEELKKVAIKEYKSVSELITEVMGNESE